MKERENAKGFQAFQRLKGRIIKVMINITIRRYKLGVSPFMMTNLLVIFSPKR